MSQVAVMGLGRASEYAIYEPEHHSEAKAWTVEAAAPPLTCWDPTPNFVSGCDLLLVYDKDADGVISYAEAQKAIQDYYDGKITKEEAEFVVSCYNKYGGVINSMCPGCYEVKKVTAAFDLFTSYSGPFTVGEKVTIAKYRVKNTGNVRGPINVAIHKLNADGSVKGDIAAWWGIYLDPGECYTCGYDCDTDTELSPCTTGSCATIGAGEIKITHPTAGTYYYGIKTWGEDEDEPSYPSPTAALAGAEVLPVAAEGEKLAIPVTVVSGLTLVGLGILQARSRRF